MSKKKAFPNLRIQFIGLVFYNGKEKLDKNHPNKDDEIHTIFKSENQGGILFCETILERQKIPVWKNFAKKTGSIQISFKDIEREIKKIRSAKGWGRN